MATPWLLTTGVLYPSYPAAQRADAVPSPTHANLWEWHRSRTCERRERAAGTASLLSGTLPLTPRRGPVVRRPEGRVRCGPGRAQRH